MEKVRQSNIKLLRLICMFFIVIFHAVFHPFLFDNIKDFPLENRYLLSIFITPFVFISVNCYVLISGYFMIRTNIKSFIRFYSQCAFYSVVIYCAISYFVNDSLSVRILLTKFFPFSHDNGLWFLPSYLTLFLIAPLLNSGVSNLCLRNYKILIGCMTFVIVYFGYFYSKTDLWVYNLLFIYFYIVGAFIRIHVNLDLYLSKIRILSIVSYILLSSILGFILVDMIREGSENPIMTIFRYDNPLMILSSIAFFLIFLTIKFQNRLVNWMAISALAIYLIQENTYVRKYFLNPIYKMYAEIDSPLLLLFTFLLYILSVCVICILIDKFRMVITSPIENLTFKIIDRLRKKEVH